MRGLRERGQSDIINRLACGVFGLEVSEYGHPNEMVDVDAQSDTTRKSSHRWKVVVSTRWKPWTMLGGELTFYGKTKGDALVAAMTFLLELQARKPVKP